MKTEENIATLLFKQIWSHNKAVAVEYENEMVWSHAVLGNLFIRSYRIFKYCPKFECIALMKYEGNRSRYLFLKFIPSEREMIVASALRDVDECVQYINQMKQAPQADYLVSLCFIDQFATKQLAKRDYQQFRSHLQANPGRNPSSPIDLDQQDTICSISGMKTYIIAPKEEEELLEDCREGLRQLRRIIYHYIDTYATRHLSNEYSDVKKRSPTSFQIETLLNTIDYILYNELNGEDYTQIQSANWTFFEIKLKDKLPTDRKDITLTGNGRILILHILLLDDLTAYLQQSENQAAAMLADSQNSYSQATLKVYRITNILHPSRIMYQHHYRTITRKSLKRQ